MSQIGHNRRFPLLDQVSTPEDLRKLPESQLRQFADELRQETIAAVCELFPLFRRMRMLRQWGGIVDTCPDASPIISKTPVEGIYINGGWGTGGFKATPGSGWVFAHTLAHDEPHPLNAAFTLERYQSGYLIDEHGAAAVAH